MLPVIYFPWSLKLSSLHFILPLQKVPLKKSTDQIRKGCNKSTWDYFFAKGVLTLLKSLVCICGLET